jgi:hypothetical protein
MEKEANEWLVDSIVTSRQAPEPAPSSPGSADVLDLSPDRVHHHGTS